MLRDTERMRGVLAAHLRWADGGEVDVRSCAVAYLHDAPNRCLVHYDLVVRDPRTGTDRPELVTGFIAGEDRAEQVAKRIGRGAPRPSVGQLVPVAHVPELDLVLQVFPFDQCLPVLHRLMAGAAPLVAAAIARDLGPGDWQIGGWEAETLRYRVDQRAMVRLTVTARDRSSGASRVRRVYAKVFRNSAEGMRSFEVQRALWNRVGHQGMSFEVARPIAYVAAAQTLLFDEVVGTNLRRVLFRSATLGTAIRQTARAVADLHQLSLEEVDFAARRRPVRDELARLEKVGAAVRADLPAAAAEIDDIVAAVAAKMGGPAIGPTHFDLKPGHILLDPPRITLLDFDKMTLADPMVDVANLLVFFHKERSGRPSGGGEHDHVRTFVDEYFAHVPAPWKAGFPAQYALALLVEAATSGRGMRGRGERSDRATMVSSLLREARHVLDWRF